MSSQSPNMPHGFPAPSVISHPQPQKEIEATRANSSLPGPRHTSHQCSSLKSLMEQGGSSMSR